MFATLSLKLRLLLIVSLAGVLFLLLGLLAVVGLKPQLEREVIEERAANLRLVLAERLKSKEDFGIGTAVALAREPFVAELLRGGDRARGGAELEAIIALYRDSTNFKSLRLHLHDSRGHSVMRSWALEQFGDDIRFRPGIQRMLSERRPFATLEVGRGGLHIKSFAPVFEGETYLGSLEVIQGVGSISRTFEEEGDRYLLLLDERLRADSPALANNLSIGNYLVANNKWFSEATLEFARGLDLEALAKTGVARTPEWFVVAEPVRDTSNAIIGLHLIGEPVAELNAHLAFVDTIAWIFGAIMIGLLLGLALAIMWAINRYVVRPVNRAVRELDEMGNDLSRQLSVTSHDELGRLIQAFNGYLETLRTVLKEVARTSAELDEAALQQQSASEQSATLARSQQSETDQVASASTEMAASAHEVAHHAESTREAVDAAERHTSEGIGKVEDSIAAINDLSAQMQAMQAVIARLEQGSAGIGQVIETIAGIAEQTNLLALNAAIEAARAGEAGRGFAVVADEVRNLSTRTQDSTREIAAIVTELQKAAHEVSASIQTNSAQAQHCVEQAARAGEALSSIRTSVSSVNNMSIEIAAASDEQSKVADEISRSMERINQLAEENARAMELSQRINAGLVERAQALRALVQRFHLN